MTAELAAQIPLLVEPGVYDGMPADLYLADPVKGRSLSSSGARQLLPPSCPALYRWHRDHGRPDKRTYDFGHAAHAQVLGIGAPIVAVQADDWRTKAAKEAAAEARAAGATPLLQAEVDQVNAMADALRDHPIASALISPELGKPEQSLFWVDEVHGVWRRARLDWLPHAAAGRMILPDYKTTVSAEPGSIRKSVANYGYHQQGAWYSDAVIALELADDVAFVFVFQEKTAPYLITIVELDAEAMRVGRHLNDRALEVYAECTATDTWPAYSDDVELVSLPPWALNALENR